MSGHNDSKSGCLRVEIELVQIVQDVNADTLQVQRLAQRDRFSPRALVIVASNSVHRCNLTQRFEDLRSADIACVNDVTDTLEGSNRFRPKQAVRIRDEADGFHVSPLPQQVFRSAKDRGSREYGSIAVPSVLERADPFQ